MVRTLTWVLVGVVLYSVLAMGLRARGYLPESIKVSGPITTLHTKRGRAFLDWLARPRRAWRAYANVGVGVGLVVMALSFLFILLSGLVGLQQEPTVLNQPRNVLVIPGVNQFIPLSVTPYVVVGLAIALVVHEGGHGLLCRVEDIDIESMGLAFLTIVPVGAFVEPDEDSQAEADRGAQVRMFAAGVTNNFAIGAITLVLLFGPVAGSLVVVDGFPVGGTLPDGPADRAGIEAGDVITSVDGTPISDPTAWNAALSAAEGERVEVTLRNRSVTVDRRLVATGAPEGSPVAINDTVTAVNGSAVYTRQAFRNAVRGRPIARLTATADGETRNVTLPMGALVRVVEDGPLAAEGAPAGEQVVITSFDGSRTLTAGDLESEIAELSPGQTTSVVAYHDGTRQTYTVRLDEHPDDGSGYLGVRFGQAGITGVEFDEFGVEPYPAGFFLEMLGGDADGDTGAPADLGIRLFFFLLLPFLGLYSPTEGFNGFVGLPTNFYVAEGPLALLGTGGVFAAANVLFWTAWINVIVGQFNLIPAFPLDGGHLLRTSTESVVSRLPVVRKRELTKVVTVSIGLAMLGGLLLALFGPRLPV